MGVTAEDEEADGVGFWGLGGLGGFGWVILGFIRKIHISLTLYIVGILGYNRDLCDARGIYIYQEVPSLFAIYPCCSIYHYLS